MIDTPHIAHSSACLTATIRLVVPRAVIRNVMGPAISEICAAVVAQGLKPAGPWFTHHFRIDPAVFDFEACVPLDRPISPAGRVMPGERRAATVARTVYCGPYEGLVSAWSEFKTWVARNGHQPAADLWECYVVGPESGHEPALWRTELNQPLLA